MSENLSPNPTPPRMGNTLGSALPENGQRLRRDLRAALSELLAPSLREALHAEFREELSKVVREELEGCLRAFQPDQRRGERAVLRASRASLKSLEQRPPPPPPRCHPFGHDPPAPPSGSQDWMHGFVEEAPDVPPSTPGDEGPRRMSAPCTPEDPGSAIHYGSENHRHSVRLGYKRRPFQKQQSCSPSEPPGTTAAVRRRAHMIGVMPSGDVMPVPPPTPFAKGETRDLKHLEQRLANELFQAADLLPADEQKEPAKKLHTQRSSSSLHGSIFSEKRRSWLTLLKGGPSRHATQAEAQAEWRRRRMGSSASLTSLRSLTSSLASIMPADQEAVTQHSKKVTLQSRANSRASLGSKASFGEASVNSLMVSNSYPTTVVATDWESTKVPTASETLTHKVSSKVPTCKELRQMQDMRLLSQFNKEDNQYTHSQQSGTFWHRLGRGIVASVPPLVGMVPWSTQNQCVGISMVYQWVVLAYMISLSFCSVKRTYMTWRNGDTALAVILAEDNILSIGALLGLLGCRIWWRSKVLTDAKRLLRSYSARVGNPDTWEKVSYVDFFCSVGSWLLSLSATVLFSVLCTDVDQQTYLHWITFAISSAVLLGICQYVLHVCQCLTKLIDAFCYQVIEQPGFAQALHTWSLLQALCRTSCSSIQFAFLALQATATALVLVSIVQVVETDITRFLSSLPALVVAMAVFRTSIWAAAVTDKCLRVPMLVNSVSVGIDLDPDRLYVVQYIEHSQAGFYLFELRLTSETVLKTAYVACAGCFFLAARLL